MEWIINLVTNRNQDPDEPNSYLLCLRILRKIVTAFNINSVTVN